MPASSTTRTALLLFEPPDGGVTENVLQLALRMRDERWTPVVAGPAVSNIRARLEAEGVEYVPIQHLRRGYGRPMEDLAALREIRTLLESRPFDVVHSHASKAGFLGRLAAAQHDVPSVYSPHCFGFVGDVSAKRRLFALSLERWLGRRTGGLLCVSDAERRVALKHRIVRPDAMRHIRHGVSCREDIAPNAELLEFRGNGLLVGAVTVLREQKRLDILIDAIPAVLERLPSAKFAIVGNGPTGDQLRAQADALGLIERGAIRFFDFEVPSTQYLRALDVYVLPSAWEAMPIGALEALACGIPQVVSAVDGSDEIVTAQTGVIVPPKEVGALAEALVSLLTDDRRRLEASQASRRRAQEVFQLSDMVAETVAFYEACMTGEAPGAAQPRRTRPGRFGRTRMTRSTSF